MWIPLVLEANLVLFCRCYVFLFFCVQWLHECRTEGCTEKALDTAAAAGHLEVVQWLHENRTEVR